MPPYLSYDKIRRSAEDFLKKYNPNRLIPVPIEEIIDLELKISIVALPDLVSRLSLDAYLEPDRSAIFIDEGVYEYDPRARFSLAHELGHLFLHNRFYELARYSNSEEYKEVRKNLLGPDADRRFDIQATNFAGLVLVPRVELEHYFEKAMEMARAGGIEPNNAPAYFLDYSASWLRKHFGVTEKVIKKRIELDKLWEIF
jgi:Zn-dependent peptidase ImmA (M78 family)